jgi:5-methylthioadenosine/S-adenosylhomocysteine deaminase
MPVGASRGNPQNPRWFQGEFAIVLDAELVVSASWVVPVRPGGALSDHAVVIGSGRIVDLLPTAEARLRYPGVRHEEFSGHALLPGLVNLHTHAAMALMRGFADDLPLMEWLRKHVWPAEARHLSAGFVEEGTRLAVAEMLLGGTTTFNDMYFFPESVCSAATAVGIRVVAGLVAVDFPTPYAPDAASALQRGLATRREFAGEPLVHFAVAPHAPYTVGDERFRHLSALARAEGLPVHCHVHETATEVTEALRTHGERPLSRLERLGVLGPEFVAVHCVHLDERDLELLAHRGVSVAHCPTSNLKLAAGLAPTASLVAAGIRVGLGTDSAASNNRLDMFAEMRLAALLAKGQSGDAAVWSAPQALRAATLGGAEALGLGAITGSLETGKAADLIAVDLAAPQLQPMFDPVSHLVYVAGREQVREVWVRGERRVRSGELTAKAIDGRFSAGALRELSSAWAARLRANPVT